MAYQETNRLVRCLRERADSVLSIQCKIALLGCTERARQDSTRVEFALPVLEDQYD
jgi:hypothetical protein